MTEKATVNSLGQPVGFLVPNWQRRPDPPRTPMEGRTCRLEPLNVKLHSEDLYRAFGNDTEGRNWTYMWYGPFSDFSDFRAWLEKSAAGSDPQFFAVVNRQTEKAVGVASYLSIDPANGSIEVGHIHFSPKLQRTTVATDAMYLMMRRAFDELGYRRYQWRCDSLNARSRAAATRFGFTFEGIFRQALIVKGRNRDTAWYSIIDQDWPRIRYAFERWLDPKNFDEEGIQREKLSDLTSNRDDSISV